ncbi:MAG: DUF3078 domain-containing protein [Prolixibacteraceae bacterium]|nr:DUF3078 domain-containing protein [Prolixibacteraceae bacterium]
MKTILTIVFTFLISTVLTGQEKDTSYWAKSGIVSLNFSEVSFSNWAAGGKSSVSGVGFLNYSANYTKEKISWENAFKFGYGLLKEGKSDVTKSEDIIDINSKLGFKSTDKLFYTVLFNFRSQLAPGYNYPNTTDKISGFMAPGFFNLAVGCDFKPSEKISVFISPVSGKMTVVNDVDLSENYGLDPGKKSRGEFGATFKGQLKTPVVKNVDVDTQLGLFSNYLDTPQNIDVTWDFLINMKINDFLSANFISNMIYDDNIKIGIDDDKDGNIDRTAKKVQFKHLLGIGLSYKF